MIRYSASRIYTMIDRRTGIRMMPDGRSGAVMTTGIDLDAALDRAAAWLGEPIADAGPWAEAEIISGEDTSPRRRPMRCPIYLDPQD